MYSSCQLFCFKHLFIRCEERLCRMFKITLFNQRKTDIKWHIKPGVDTNVALCLWVIFCMTVSPCQLLVSGIGNSLCVCRCDSHTLLFQSIFILSVFKSSMIHFMWLLITNWCMFTWWISLYYSCLSLEEVTIYSKYLTPSYC